MTPREILIYDTTLRDGSQGEGVAFSLEDKLEIAERLDDLGVHYIEGGWPGSNPKDVEFFREQRKLKLSRAKIAAFGSTRRANLKVDEDKNVRMLADCGMPVITVFGKSWDLHVTDALRTTLEENLRMVKETVAFLLGKCDELIFDAEHFFDGYFKNRDYAMATLRAAAGAGAKVLVLCDTNGGRLSGEIARAVDEVREEFPGLTIGIHAHNDSGLAAANTVAAVEHGCSHVQGTVNGLGERCGNADLCTVIPTLQIKLGLRCLPEDELKKLTEVSRFIYETAVLQFRDNQPYVGRSAFAHKGGVHVSAVRRNPVTYEHVVPETVGNERRVLVSELSGRSTLLAKSPYDLTRHPEKMKEILERLQELENYGYQFEAAEASFELLVRKAVGEYTPFFELRGFRVISEKREDGTEITEATIKLAVDGEEEHTASEGNGPVNALDGALRKALLRFYPVLREVSLVNYKVRIVDAQAATAARVRVTIESRDGTDRWTTVGVSENIIEASWIALVDSIEYKLFKDMSA